MTHWFFCSAIACPTNPPACLDLGSILHLNGFGWLICRMGLPMSKPDNDAKFLAPNCPTHPHDLRLNNVAKLVACLRDIKCRKRRCNGEKKKWFCKIFSWTDPLHTVDKQSVFIKNTVCKTLTFFQIQIPAESHSQLHPLPFHSLGTAQAGTLLGWGISQDRAAFP